VQQAAGESVSWVFPPRCVLVVDDGRENRELLRVVLGEAGLKMVEAENGAIGLDQAAAHDPDLILMDIQMPVMDGITATRTLRERGFTKPVLALTANAMKGFEREIERGGFTGHMTKPIDIDVLLARPGRAAGRAQGAGRRRAGRGGRAGGSRRAGRHRCRAAARRAGAAALQARLHPRLARVVATFCEQLPGKLKAMHALLQAGDHDSLAAQAHWLEGAGGSVGFDAFFEPARELEHAARAADAAAAARALQTLAGLARRIVSPSSPSSVPPAAGGAAAAQAAPLAATSEAAAAASAALERARAAAQAGEPLVGAWPGTRAWRAWPRSSAEQLPGRLDEMADALGRADHERLAALAHWLKGAGGTVGFDAFFEPARALELAARAGTPPRRRRNWRACARCRAGSCRPPRQRRLAPAAAGEQPAVTTWSAAPQD
jgi:CheY-like chemotaxis protein